MISFYDVVRIPLEDMASTGGVLIDAAGRPGLGRW
jgi:hypothetical protein